MVGLSDAPIPWPHFQAGKWHVPVVYGGLGKAVRRESEQAVAPHWGVGHCSVWQWRKALGIGATTEGTSRLRRDHFAEPWAEETRQKAWAKARDPERRAKIAAAKRGKPRPPYVIEALRAVNRGRPLSAETRRKMSEAHKRRGTRPPKAGRPWTAFEDRLARKLPVAEAARRTGRTDSAVKCRRRLLGLPDGRRRRRRAGK
jgi:hypothetical protein